MDGLATERRAEAKQALTDAKSLDQFDEYERQGTFRLTEPGRNQ